MTPKDVKETGSQDPLAIHAAFLIGARGVLIALGARISTQSMTVCYHQPMKPVSYILINKAD